MNFINTASYMKWVEIKLIIVFFNFSLDCLNIRNNYAFGEFFKSMCFRQAD